MTQSGRALSNVGPDIRDLAGTRWIGWTVTRRAIDDRYLGASALSTTRTDTGQPIAMENIDERELACSPP
jgi:hypothetical protein